MQTIGIDRSVFELRGCCPLCSDKQQLPHLVIDGFHIVRCGACSFLYVDEVVPDSVSLGYYADGYAGIRQQQGQDVNASINVEVLRAIGVSRGKSLLDIGSGYGFLLQRARDKLGMIVAGAELSIAERTFANETLGVETYDNVDSIPENRKFDVVSLFEVIEHIRLPGAMFDQATRLLRPGGFMVIGTDNFESLAVRMMGAGFPKWIPHQHISLFAPKTLRQLASRTGRFLIKSELSHTPWEYWVRIIVQKLSGGKKGMKNFLLEDELRYEESNRFKYFHLRRALNSLYTRLTRRMNLDCSMMYLVLQKTHD